MTRNAFICAARGCEGCAICMPRTAWFPASTDPVHEGDYEFQLASRIHPPFMAHFSRSAGWTKDGVSFLVFKFYDYWRGLARKPA